MSLGGDNYTAPCDAESPAMTTIIQSLRAANIATVIASGNAGQRECDRFPGVHLVGDQRGLDHKQNQISSFSNSASFLSLLAPGGA